MTPTVSTDWRAAAHRGRAGLATFGAIVVLFGGLLVWGGFHDAVLTQGPGVRRAQGVVAAVETLQGFRETHTRITVLYRDREGRERRFQEAVSDPGEAPVGSRVHVIYHLDPARDFHRRANSMEHGIRWTLWIGGALLILEGLVIAGTGILRTRRRLWLLQHGRREEAVVVGTRVNPFAGFRNIPPTWRVLARWLDTERGQWRDVRSDYCQPETPAPSPGERIVVFVDPRRPRRYWLPWPP